MHDRSQSETAETKQNISSAGIQKVGGMLWVFRALEFYFSELPNHSSPKVKDVLLGEIKCLLTARKRFHELTGEDATVDSVFLLWDVLRKDNITI